MKIFLIVLALFVSLDSINSYAGEFSNGDGTEESPWVISNIDELNSIRNYLGEDYNETYFVLGNNLDFSQEIDSWEPIGTEENPFCGIFNGNGNSISNLKINNETRFSQVGFFGVIRDGGVKNLYLEDVEFEITGDLSNIINTGIVSGEIIGGTISNVGAKGTINYSDIANSNNIGGIVGTSVQSVVSASFADVQISGGLVGALVAVNNSGKIINCYSKGEISGSSGSAGLVAVNNNGTIKNSYSLVNLDGEDVDALCLFNIQGEIDGSFWDKELTNIEESDWGDGENSEQMRDFYTYIDVFWEFAGHSLNEVWNISSDYNDGYPFLTWENKDADNVDLDFQPYITFESVDNVSHNSAMFEGDVVLMGNPKSEYYGFCWSKDSNPTLNDSYKSFSQEHYGKLQYSAEGLESDEKYYVRSFIVYDSDTIYSNNEKEFSTNKASSVKINLEGEGELFFELDNSLIPAQDTAFEQGMYLTLNAVPNSSSYIKSIEVNTEEQEYINTRNYYFYFFLDKDYEVDVKFTKFQYSIHYFTPMGGTIVADQVYNHGDDAVIEIIPDEGWYISKIEVNGENQAITNRDGQEYVFENITSDNGFVVSFEQKILFEVKFFDKQGELLSTQIIEEGFSAEAPSLDDVEGFEFVGWDELFSSVTEDLVVRPVYEIKTYEVVFSDYDGEIILTQQVEHGGFATVAEDPVREGYIFTGWNGDYESVTEDVIVVAVYVEIQEDETYEVTFVDYDQTVLKTQTVVEGYGATAPTRPIRTGYEFSQWAVDFSNITQNLTVIAEYEPKLYSVSFMDYNGVLIGEVQNVEHGSNASAPDNPQRLGYTFTGWSDSYNDISQNMTLVAEYIINEYEVIFVDYNEDVLDRQFVEHGESASAPNSLPQRQGYIFHQWSHDFSVITEDITITAQYEAVVSLLKEDDNKFSLKIGPNPISNILVISVAGAYDLLGTSIKLRIYDSRKRLFKTKELKIGEKVEDYVVNVDSLVPGICYLVLEINDSQKRIEYFTKVE